MRILLAFDGSAGAERGVNLLCVLHGSGASVLIVHAPVEA
jgi:hypothetical protein